MSAESGIATFRDSDGLWNNHRIEDVATPEAWQRDPEMVLAFYNARRQEILQSEPNLAHQTLANLEAVFDVQIVTQNIDDLHERAGSTNVYHVHGEIMQSRSSVNPALRYDTHGKDIHIGDLCDSDFQLRPHVVWFGETIENFDIAKALVQHTDHFLVIGTSLAVFPIASLLNFVRSEATKTIVTLALDSCPDDFEWLAQPACEAVPVLADQWRTAYA